MQPNLCCAHHNSTWCTHSWLAGRCNGSRTCMRPRLGTISTVGSKWCTHTHSQAHKCPNTTVRAPNRPLAARVSPFFLGPRNGRMQMRWPRAFASPRRIVRAPRTRTRAPILTVAILLALFDAFSRSSRFLASFVHSDFAHTVSVCVCVCDLH